MRTLATKMIYGVAVTLYSNGTYNFDIQSKGTKAYLRWYNAARTKKALLKFKADNDLTHVHTPKHTNQQLKAKSLQAVKQLKRKHVAKQLVKLERSIKYYANRIEQLKASYLNNKFADYYSISSKHVIASAIYDKKLFQAACLTRSINQS